MDRARVENRVLAEMVSLAQSSHEYSDVVQAALDLVEQIITSPFLSLLIEEVDGAGFYVRSASGTDPEWTEDVASYVSSTQRQQLVTFSVAPAAPLLDHTLEPAAWLAAFAAGVRTGRRCILTLGCQHPLSLLEDEERIMARLVRQMLLVLDHALLSHLAEDRDRTDSLTGVANHRRLLEILEYEMQRHRYLGRTLALLMVDVDGLERINRSYGRQYGNHILAKLAGLLTETIRPIDIPARSGQDEFAAILPETDDDDAERLVERLRERLLGVGFAGGTVDLTVGAVHARPEETLSAESLLRRGEQMLQVAKRQERGWQERVAGLREYSR